MKEREAGESASRRIMKKRFPQYLSQPFMILSFEPDEQLIIFMSVIGGITIWGWGLAIPVFLPYIYIRVKKKYPRGFLKHVFYILGFINFEGYPTYHEKEFIE